MDLQKQKNAACESRPVYILALSLVCLDKYNPRVWLSCQAIKWISVLAGLCQVFAKSSHIYCGNDYPTNYLFQFLPYVGNNDVRFAQAHRLWVSIVLTCTNTGA